MSSSDAVGQFYRHKSARRPSCLLVAFILHKSRAIERTPSCLTNPSNQANSIMPTLSTLPTELQLEIFGHHFRSFNGQGHFVSNLKSASDEGNRKSAERGPNALLLVSRQVKEVALVASLGSRTRVFKKPRALERFVHRHVKEDTAKHLRTITLDLRAKEPTLRAWWDAMEQCEFSNRMKRVTKIELIMDYERYAKIPDSLRRERILRIAENMRHILPPKTRTFAFLWPALEPMVQAGLDDAVCTPCAQIAFWRFLIDPPCAEGWHTCADDDRLTPETFEQISRKEQLAVTDRCERYPRELEQFKIQSQETAEAKLAAFHGRWEWREWMALRDLNEEAMSVVCGEREGK